MTGMRFAVQERAGRANKTLAKSEPLKKEKCERDNCFVCTTGTGNCEKNGVGYEVTCQACLLAGSSVKFVGEYGRNG